jgi:two-component system sensor histidine kinase DegS
MRSLILDLHPPSISEIGLVPALRQQINRLKRSAGPEISISTAGEHRLSAELEEGLFRIAQESLRNAVKHSGGSKISLDLVMSQNAVVLTVSDNGRGFDPSRPLDRRAFGLIGMRERAELLGANLSIETLPGRGTKVTVNVPIDKRG